MRLVFWRSLRRRGRGDWPLSGPMPVFRYWTLGPLELRRYTPAAVLLDYRIRRLERDVADGFSEVSKVMRRMAGVER